MNQNIPFIPKQTTGKQVDLDYKVEADNPATAKTIFTIARDYLLQPGLWHQLAGAATATFSLATPGKSLNQLILQEGDYINIDIPGPGSKLGDGLDWTQVKAISENVCPGCDESYGVTLTASSNPENDSQETAHFFDHISSSSFVLQRIGNQVAISYHGRNEVPNRHTQSAADNVRNTLVAAGAAAGLSELQWTALLKGLLDTAVNDAA